MHDRRDLALVLKSGMPLVVIETTDEERLLELLRDVARAQPAEGYRPLFRWTITDGLQRLDLDLAPQRHNAEPADVLRHIRAVSKPGIYALLDFHPFMADAVNIRLLKDVAMAAPRAGMTVLLISHELAVPAEIQRFSARFQMRLPDADARRSIIERLAEDYRQADGRNVEIDPDALHLLVRNLAGLTHADVERLARNAIYQDGAITASDLPAVMRAKHQLLNRDGVLSYEYDTAVFADIAGFRNLKVWLEQRRLAFTRSRPPGLDPPKGLLLIGVQGCGKSVAAKAAAGVFGVPLLRLDIGALYNKYHGETERNVRSALATADLMSPCVLWIDEMEKGLATGMDDSGTSRRLLASLLTWMAERRSETLIVATSNDVRQLPPELLRKGRFDEIFFVDLPSLKERAEIFGIHLRKRGLQAGDFDLAALGEASEGFSGAEIEQAVVSALYAAHALRQPASTAHVLAECRRTRPLSVLMAEQVEGLREWARSRTVPSN